VATHWSADVSIALSDAELQAVIDYLASEPSAWRFGGIDQFSPFSANEPYNPTPNFAPQSPSPALRQSGWHFCFCPSDYRRQGNVGSRCFSRNLFSSGRRESGQGAESGVFSVPVPWMYERTPVVVAGVSSTTYIYRSSRLTTEEFYSQGQVILPMRIKGFTRGLVIDEDGSLWAKGDGRAGYGLWPPTSAPLESNALGLGPGITNDGSVQADRRRRYTLTRVLGDSVEFARLTFKRVLRIGDTSFALADTGDLYVSGAVRDGNATLILDVAGTSFDGTSDLPYFRKWKSDVSDIAGLTNLYFIQNGEVKRNNFSSATTTTFGPIYDWTISDNVSFSSFLQPLSVLISSNRHILIKSTAGRIYTMLPSAGANTLDSDSWRITPSTIDDGSGYFANDAGAQDVGWQNTCFGVDGRAWSVNAELSVPAASPRPQVISVKFVPSTSLPNTYKDYYFDLYRVDEDYSLWAKGPVTAGHGTTPPAGGSIWEKISGEAQFDKVFAPPELTGFDESRGFIYANRIGELFDDQGNRLNPISPITAP
jgi:hypothetical protein